MRRASFLLIGGVGLFAAAGTGVLMLRDQGGAAKASLAGADIAPRAAAIAALGRIEPESETLNLGGATTDVLAELTVGRGASVARGEVIGHFRGYGEAVARERATAQQLAEAKAQLVAEQVLGENRVRSAQAQLDGILAVGPARIDNQVARVHSAEIDLANNVDILNGWQQLKRSEFASRRTLEDQRALVARQRSDMVAARAQLEQLQRQFESDRATAEATLAVERATTARAQAQIPVASLEQQLALAHAQMVSASLIAPIDGTVLNVLVHAGEAVGNSPIVALGNTAKMHAVAEVYETDVPRVRLGQRAKVTSPALEQPLTGKVVEIGRMIFKNDVLNVDPVAKTDARIVQVRIELDDGTAVAGLTNLTVDVLITPDLPIAAVESAPQRP
jgi:HlyD family secretion protein